MHVWVGEHARFEAKAHRDAIWSATSSGRGRATARTRRREQRWAPLARPVQLSVAAARG